MFFVLVIFVAAPPPEPRRVGFFDVKSDQISIQWMVPEGFKAFDILSYEVEHWIFGKTDKLKNKLLASEAKTEYSYRIQNLEPETTYMIRVAAINVYGSNYNDEKGQETLAACKSIFRFCFVFFCLFVCFFLVLCVCVSVCVFITNCREYCLVFLGVVSAVLERPPQMSHTCGNI